LPATKILSVQDNGLTGALIEIECQLSNSLPNVVIVGLAGKSLDEAKESFPSFASFDPEIRALQNEYYARYNEREIDE
jgi:hypothetical protein